MKGREGKGEKSGVEGTGRVSERMRARRRKLSARMKSQTGKITQGKGQRGKWRDREES